MSARQRRLLPKLALTVCSILAGLCLAEIGFRLGVRLNLFEYPRLDPNQVIHKYADNPELVYELKPSASGYMINSVIIRTNTLGMRDREYSLVKPPGVTRLAVVGDSVAFGGDMELEKIFSELLEARLAEAAPGKYEVMNFSAVGYNSAQEEIVLREKVLKTAPDVVFLAYCLNDVTYSDGLGELAREMHPSSLGPRLRSKLVSYLLHRKERRDFDKLSDFAPVEHLFETLASLGASEGFRPVVLIFPYRYASVNDYPFKEKHETLRNLVRKNSLAFVDFMEAWSGMSAEERNLLFTPDGIHLTPLGMQRVADYLFARPELYAQS